MSPSLHPTLSLLTHPYRLLTPVTGGKPQLRSEGRLPGSALVWHLHRGAHEQDAAVVNGRPGGLPLIVILPPFPTPLGDPDLIRTIEAARPAAVLPFHPTPDPDDLAAVLRRPPEDLGVEVTDYLAWRGLSLDRETIQLVRRTVALSADLRSITGLCRSMYLSRRALGRRFLCRGLPVPSHWLHFARLLRVTIRLQNSQDSVFSVGYELGYPDAFSLSNQMVRLTGVRPVEARAFLGWEWLLESWLRREADAGALAPYLTMDLLSGPGPMRHPATEARYVAEAPRLRLRRDRDPTRAAG